jgi:hypothetical protein
MGIFRTSLKGPPGKPENLSDRTLANERYQGLARFRAARTIMQALNRELFYTAEMDWFVGRLEGQQHANGEFQTAWHENAKALASSEGEGKWNHRKYSERFLRLRTSWNASFAIVP